MEFFSCNNCKRCRRRNSSTGDEENDVDVDRTISRRGRVVRPDNNNCCTAAVMYFYAGRRTDNRSRVKFTGAALDQIVTTTTVDRPSTPNELPVATRGSILKNSGDSPSSNASGRNNDNNNSSGSGRSPSSVVRGSSKSGSSSPGPTDKRASFNEAVDVIVADDVTGKPVLADHVQLKRAPEDQRHGVEPDWRRPKSDTVTMMVYPPASRCRHAFAMASADVERRPDGSRYLRAVIRPTAERHRETPVGLPDERLVVRAAGKGSKLVVGAYRPEPLGDGTNYLRQYIDRFSLPHAIETTSMRANLAPTGVLVVTAAIHDSSDSETDDDAAG